MTGKFASIQIGHWQKNNVMITEMGIVDDDFESK